MSLKDGLTKKEKFTPEHCSPKESKIKGTSRPKSNDPMIKRSPGAKKNS